MRPIAWVRSIRRSDLLGPNPGRSLAHLARALARHGPSLFTVVAWRAVQDPGRIALRQGEVEFTYRELESAGEAVARWLTGHRISPSGPQIALWCQRPSNAVVALLAAQRLGVDVVLLNTFMSRHEVAQVVEREGRILVSDDPAIGELHLPNLDPTSGFLAGVSSDRADSHTEHNPIGLPRTSRVARISILSSGTSAAPHLVRAATTVAALDTVADFVAATGVRRGDRARVLVPLFHGHGLGTVQLGLVLGGTMTLRPTADQRCDGYRSDWLALGSTDLIVGVPTVLHRLVAARPSETDQVGPSKVRAIITGSAPLAETTLVDLTTTFGAVVHNVYGTSETGLISHAGPDQLAQDSQTVGSVLLGLECQIRDRDGHRLPTAESGEVWVRGGMVGRQWRRTGDLGRLDSRGWLSLRGRADDTVVVGGELVVPEVLEARIRTAAGVVDCAVRAIPDAEYGARVELVVQLEPGMTTQELHSELKRTLPRTLRPVSIIEVAHLPRTALGKLQRHRLPASSTPLPDSA